MTKYIRYKDMVEKFNGGIYNTKTFQEIKKDLEETKSFSIEPIYDEYYSIISPTPFFKRRGTRIFINGEEIQIIGSQENHKQLHVYLKNAATKWQKDICNNK